MQLYLRKFYKIEIYCRKIFKFLNIPKINSSNLSKLTLCICITYLYNIICTLLKLKLLGVNMNFFKPMNNTARKLTILTLLFIITFVFFNSGIQTVCAAQKANYMPTRSSWKANEALYYHLPEENVFLSSLPFLGSDGYTYLSVEKLLSDMGYSYTWSGVAASKPVIEWQDSDLGDYWIDINTKLLHGPELLVKLSEIHLIDDEYYVPIRQVIEGCYWSYFYDYSTKTATIERLIPSYLTMNKTLQLVHIYGISQSGKEKLMRTVLSSSGSIYDSTRNGTFKFIALPLLSQHKYYFSGPKVYIKYCSSFDGDCCIHTPYTPERYNLNTSSMKKGYEILGQRGSDGCVRMLFNDAKFIHCLANGLKFTVGDGGKFDWAVAEKTRLLNQQPSYNDWINQMLLYE